MENEINLSRDYVTAFNEAEKKGQVEEMSRTFRELCGELGIQDLKSDQAQAAAARAVALLLNARDKGENGKKI